MQTTIINQIKIIYGRVMPDNTTEVMSTKTRILGLIAFWGAVAASGLLALNLAVSGWAYILFSIANIASILILKDTNTPRILSYQLYFFQVVNLVGIYNWLL